MSTWFASLLSFPFFCIDHGDRFIHVSSVLNSFFGSKTRDNRMLHNTSIVSWIAIAFVGLLELSEFASRAKGTDRAEKCEVLKDRLHQVETESKELREQSCWIFQFQCSWTCSLLQLALLSVAMLTVSWICVRSCTRRVNVVVDSDGSQKRGHPASVVVGWCDELDSSGEEMRDERPPKRPSGLISELGGVQRCWWELAGCSRSLL